MPGATRLPDTALAHCLTMLSHCLTELSRYTATHRTAVSLHSPLLCFTVLVCRVCVRSILSLCLTVLSHCCVSVSHCAVSLPCLCISLCCLTAVSLCLTVLLCRRVCEKHVGMQRCITPGNNIHNDKIQGSQSTAAGHQHIAGQCDHIAPSRDEFSTCDGSWQNAFVQKTGACVPLPACVLTVLLPAVIERLCA